MSYPSQLRRALGLAAEAVLLCGLAASPAFATTKKAKKPPATKQVKSPKFAPGSQETTKERVARLKRECKGQVNAGACEGYTR